MDIANLIIAIAGILVGMLIARITIRHDRQLAKESGALRKPEVGLSIFGCKVGEGYPDNENWFFIYPGEPKDGAIFPIEITVYNMGDAITDEILISINVPSRIFGKAQLASMITSIRPSLVSDSIKQSFDEIGNFTIISFAMPPLSPNSSLKLVLPFFFISALQDLSFPINIDNTTVTPHFSVLFQNIISVTIHTGNLAAKLYRIDMGAISALNLADAIQKFCALQQKSPRKSIVDTVLDLFKYTEFNVTNFVSFEIENVVQSAESKVFTMKSPHQYFRHGWPNIPASDINKLTNLEAGSIVSVIDVEKVPKSQQKFRLKQGNTIRQ